MRASSVLVAGVCGVAATEAFVFHPSVSSRVCQSGSRRQEHQTVGFAAVADVGGGSKDSAVVEGKESAWDGKSWPKRSDMYEAMPSDTRHWEVENERLPVWDDEPNPVEELTGTEWYTTFAPSDVEIAAAEMGFDWTDEWFEKNGITREDIDVEE